jgi:hypothetical protein
VYQVGYDAPVAQWIERRSTKAKVVGSSPAGRANEKTLKVCEPVVRLKPLGFFVFAHQVSESTGSIIETQDALGHKHAATTRVYVQRIAIKKDRHSTPILDRLNV